MNEPDHSWPARLVRLFTSGELTVGLREAVIVAVCGVAIAVLGAVLLS